MPSRRYKISDKNPYKISHYKALELRYFCLQYPEWKKEYANINIQVSAIRYDTTKVQKDISKQTEELAIRLKNLSYKISLIEETAHLANPEIEKWLIKGVTEETNYHKLLLIDGIPCCEKHYYNMRRKFFYLLSKER